MKNNMFDPFLAKVQKKVVGWKSKILSFGGKIVLIKHVLNSMPIHMLSGYSAENKKRKWISWKQICLPVEEGGLGIRAFHEVQESLLMKFAWKLIKGGTMWSDFFASKYVGNDHVFSVKQKNRGSRFWKGIIALMPKVLNNSKWLIREGNVNFWMENWLGDGSLKVSMSIIENEKLQVKDMFDESRPILNRIQPLVNDAILAKIVASSVQLKPGTNICVWQHTINGEFPTKLTWQLIRNRDEVCSWKKWLWKEWIPKNVFFCLES
ncbi:hypothetical protein CIPAW_14G109400 [Carya illinoinensis]|uniref:Uncharacterized protein n=1 Tax=Carya illinoinensis TaxID=32201 RepID=A0A8T1NHB3_CARIL|nr:hypothetical protein CIPAW_14G109400 [Carya illinoinensis]